MTPAAAIAMPGPAQDQAVARRTERAAGRLLASATLRLALVYMALFAISVGLLLGFIYWSTAAYMARQTDETVQAEITGLAERYRLTGLSGLVGAIRERLSRNPQGSAIYLLVDPAGRPVTGNLSGWPDVAEQPDGWMVFDLGQASLEGEATHRARARPFVLAGGFRLLVGRDVHDLDRIRTLVAQAIGWGLAMTVLLAIAGAWVMSRSTGRRIEAISQASREIMDGDLGRRIETRGSGDEFDRLAASLNRMLERIEALMDGVRHVADGIAHDLRTPLTRLRNRLEALQGPGAGNPDHVAEAIAEADGLLATFNALLRIARIEAGARHEAFRDLPLDALLGDVVELYEPLADERGQRIAYAPAAGLVARGDRDLLFQAFANLVDNAVKHGREGGLVEVAAARRDGRVRVEIRDDGPGIPADARARVFERFARLDASRSVPGSGLGLSLVKAVAALHGATVTLDDAGPGLRVTLAFPPPGPS